MTSTRLCPSIPAFRPSLFLKSLLTLAVALCCSPSRSTAQSNPGAWAWMGQNSLSAPSYEAEYQFDPVAWPGFRQQATGWTDNDGRLWLFGGITRAYINEVPYEVGSDDMWVFDPRQGEHGEWAWMGGSQAGTCGPDSGQYCPAQSGNEYEFADGNTPGSRQGSYRWVDLDGKLWLFGGQGGDSNGNGGWLNDLWAFDPSRGAHGQWAWMGGSRDLTCDPSRCSGVANWGTKYQFAPGNLPAGRLGAMSWSDSKGRFWLFSGNQFALISGTLAWELLPDLWVFDPSAGPYGEWAWMGGNAGPSGSPAGVYGTEYQFSDSGLPGARQASSAWADDSGRLWLFGGYGYDSAADLGNLNDLWLFDPTQGDHGQWAWMGGATTAAWQPATFGTKFTFAPGNAPGVRAGATGWTDLNGRFWMYGGQEFGNVDELWAFDPHLGTHGEWAWMGGHQTLNGGWPAVVGTEYEFAASNSPGTRVPDLSWTDGAGNLWLYGGVEYYEGYDPFARDLWEYRFRVPQTISFPKPATPLTYGDPPVTLAATASSGLPVTLKLGAGPATLSGAVLTITGAGSAAVISATQSGNLAYYPAPTVQDSIWVFRAPLTVMADNKTIQYGSTVPALTWTPTGFVNGDTASVLTGAPTLSTIVTSTTLPGTYGIKIARNTLTAANYLIEPKQGTITVQPLGTVAAPTFSLSSGTYTGAQSVRVLPATIGSLFFYTTDGSTPSSTHGTKYTGPITVSASETINVIAVKAGYTPSTVVSATYTIQ